MKRRFVHLYFKLSSNTPRAIREQAHHDWKVFFALVNNLRPYVDDLSGKRILDIGCGRRFPWTLLLTSIGANVTGIDLEVVSTAFSVQKYASMAASVGTVRAVKKMAREWLERIFYWRSLQAVCGFPLRYDRLDIRVMDATCLDFEDGTFDLIVSNAAFEHIADVPLAAREMRRVLKQDGVAYLSIHLFPSISGGHNLMRSMPGTDTLVLGDVPPWDHLRSNKYPSKDYLNRLRERDYRRIFEKEFEILEWKTEFEEPPWVRNYLTPEVHTELAEYSEDELLKRSVIVILQKTSRLDLHPSSVD